MPHWHLPSFLPLSTQGPCLSVCGVALRAVLGGWVAVQERAVFKWFGDGRNLPCRASKDCPGIVQVRRTPPPHPLTRTIITCLPAYYH